MRSSGRGKHVARFSYYHIDLIDQMPYMAQFLKALRHRFDEPRFDFNVVKLSRAQLSFLEYDHFEDPFPALLKSLYCDVSSGRQNFTDYSRRRNPPILHRKELLLPANHPLVPVASRLTERLESLGAFQSGSHIGTRNGWLARLRSLGFAIHDGELVNAT